MVMVISTMEIPPAKMALHRLLRLGRFRGADDRHDSDLANAARDCLRS